MTHCTAWILAILLCRVLAQLPTSTTSEYTQPKYNAVPSAKEVIMGAIFYSSDWVSELRTHLMDHRQISSDIYLVNSGIKSNVESSEGI